MAASGPKGLGKCPEHFKTKMATCGASCAGHGLIRTTKDAKQHNNNMHWELQGRARQLRAP